MAETQVKVYNKLPLDAQGKLYPPEKRLISPRNLVIISFPKSGKTETMVNQKNILIGDAQGGTDYFMAQNTSNLLTYTGDEPFKVIGNGTFVPMGIFQTVDELNKANDMKKYWELYIAFKESRGDESKRLYDEVIKHIQKMPFPIFAIDPITDLQETFHEAALADYNKQMDKKKTNIKRVDDYGGSQYIRRTVMGVKEFIQKNASPFIIFTGHIKEKKKIIEKDQDSVSVAEMDLEGTLSTIFTQRSDANGLFYRDKKGCWLDFVKKDADTDFDSRPPHLANKKIKIAELHTYDANGNVIKKGETHWNLVYPELNW